MPSQISLYNGDCMEAMKEMPDKAFDLAIVDPPYGIGDFTRSTAHGRKIVRNFKRPTWNKCVPSEEYFIELNRVSDRQLIWGANYYNCFSKDGGALIWHKGKRASTLSQCEIASLSWQKRVDYVEIYLQTGFAYTDDVRIHPCQKPIDLYAWILNHYAPPQALPGTYKILDTHLGSGSIAIACYDMGFDLTGFEIDKDYYDAAVKRLDNHKKQITFL